MENSNNQAKVFISCGQHTSEERTFARNLKNELAQSGFDPYVAVEDQSIEGFKETIFHELEFSDYFLFIDFKREILRSDNTHDGDKYHRGSLFTNQELALASFLNLPIIAFQENGVKKGDGLLFCIQANPLLFDSKDDLVEKVIQKVNDEHWDAHAKTQLIVQKLDNYFTVTFDYNDPKQIPIRVFHLAVKNLHSTRQAKNCCAFIERIYDPDLKKELSFETGPMKWKGNTVQNIVIRPKSEQQLDLFFCLQESPSKFYISPLTDYGGYGLKFEQKNLDFVYSIYSENFPTIFITISIRYSETLHQYDYEIADVNYSRNRR